MADSKITALTAISTVDPAADPLVIVDVSDTSMAASGTTKKATINQLLGASGTATLASATISGDLTVDTSTLKVDSANNRVGVGTASPTRALSVVGSAVATYANINSGDNTSLVGILLGGTSTPSAGQVIYDNTANSLAFFTSGATQMTLNATGLGVGVANPDFKFAVNGTQAVPATTGSATDNGSLRIGAPGTGLVIDTGVTASAAVYGWIQARARTDYSSNFNLVLQPNGGNVGIGITPITSHILSCSGPIGISGTNSGTRTSYISNSGVCSIYYTDGGGSGFFTDFGNLIIQPRTSAARSVVIATGSTTPVERAVVKSTGQVRFVPLASDPAGAEAGDVYYNSTSNKLKCYNGTTWNDLF